MNNDEYQKKVELEILQIIEQKLKSHEMNADRARTISKYVLESLHPHMPIEQLKIAVDKMDDFFPELLPITTKVTVEAEDKIKKTIFENVGDLLKKGKIEEANKILESSKL